MSTSVFQQLCELMRNKCAIYFPLWSKSREDFGEEWEREISIYISKAFGETYNPLWEEAVKGYAAFCTDALKAQAYFERHGQYKASSYADCVKLCYHSPDYMKLRYLPGQYLSHYIWPHHQRMLRHYVKELIPMINGEVSLFYEVGVGCGMYSQKTLEGIPRVRGIGIDISDYALEFTYRIIKAHGFGDRYEIRNQDITKQIPEEKADFVISQEVLEHLEDPMTFIDSLYKVVRPGGWGYITAAINAGHADHIYLYHSPDDVKRQIEKSGWKVCVVQIEESYPEKPKELRPTIAGFLARKGM